MPLTDRTSQLLLISAWNDSGGGFLHRLLDGHPDIASWPFELQLGTDFRRDVFSEMFHAKYRWPKFLVAEENRAAIFDQIIDDELKSVLRGAHKPKFDGFVLNVDIDIWRERFVHARTVSQPNGWGIIAAYVDTFMAELRGAKNATYIAGHCPSIVIDTNEILADFPDAKIVHIIRDPVAGLASFRRRHRHFAVEDFAARWSVVNGAASTMASAYPSSIMLIRYEWLITERKAAMEKVLDFLGLPFNPSVLTPSWNGRALNEKHMEPFGGVQSIGGEFEDELRASISPDDIAQMKTETAATLTALPGITSSDMGLWNDPSRSRA